MRGASEATPEVVGYIRRGFRRFLEREGKDRLLEKTPTNCFRVPFVREVLPEAFLVHVVRDGRDVALSALGKWQTRPDRSALVRRARSFEIPLREVVHYLPDFARDVIGRTLVPRRGLIWGPRFPGMEAFRKEHTLLETCAAQWARSVEAVEEGLRPIPEEDRMEVRYEDLVRDPGGVLGPLLDRAALEGREEVLARAREVVTPGSVGRWREAEEEVRAVLPLMQDTLGRLGYG